MVGSGRIIGLILVVFGVAAAVIGSLWLMSGTTTERLSTPGAILGLGLLVLFVALPLIAAGVYFWIKGGAEATEQAQLDKERRILSAVTTRGQVRLAELALEMNMSRSQLKDAVYDLVGKELFVGYIDWKEGVLYAREAAQMNTGKCPSCGAPRSMAGKGIVKCEYCGAELFLPAVG
ncbi:MAG: hypothetical protein ACUVX1_09640 [Chloroflexota bacterium]